MTTKKFLKRLNLERYFRILLEGNETILICTWPTYKKQNITKDGSLQKTGQNQAEVKQSKAVDDFRRQLIRAQMFVEAISANNLRQLGFNANGPVVAISFSGTPDALFQKLPETVNVFSFSPIGLFHKGIYYPDYTLFTEKKLEGDYIYSKRNNIYTSIICGGIQPVQHLLTFHKNIIKNILIKCTRLK